MSDALPDNTRPEPHAWMNSPEPVPPDWQALLSAFVSMPTHGWIFRGVASYEYAPTSKLERVLQSTGVHRSQWPRLENKALAFFKDRARHAMRDLPREHDLLHWLAFMQHYGAPTRLTDWSVSPLVALFFAYESTLHEAIADRNGALWMLNAALIRKAFGSLLPWERDHTGTVATETDGKLVYEGLDLTAETVADEQNNLLRQAMRKEMNMPFPLPILRADPRMVAQQACFVVSGRLSDAAEKTALESLLEPGGYANLTPERLKYEIPLGGAWIGPAPVVGLDDGRPILAWDVPGFVAKKIRLPWAWRGAVLAALSKFNINAATLFPTLDGVGRATEAFLHTGQPTSLHSDLGL